VSTTAVPRPDHDVARSALATLAELHQAPVMNPLLATRPTGFDPLDEVLAGGVRPGELLLIGGKPGVGKTITCLQWAQSMARQGFVALYVCYEHDHVSLLTRLLSCEFGEAARATSWPADSRREELQARLHDVVAGAIALREALDSDPLLAEAERRLIGYADRLIFLPGSNRHGLGAIGEVLQRFEGEPAALFVDYVQKVPVLPASASESERVGRAVEGLKALALERQIPVVAVAAADQGGLSARRLHLHHFRGSAALAYEADAIVMLNEKLAIVSKAHVAYTLNRAEEFDHQVVFSVEKNRNGDAGIDLEFEKDFSHYRFDPRGAWVAERLWREGSLET